MTILKPSRRDILKLASVAPAFALPAAIPGSARAQLGAPAGANPGHFRFTLGEARVTILSDGFFSLPTTGTAINADRDEVARFLEAHYLDPAQGYSHTNHVFVELGEAKVLVDVGSGSRFFDTTGRLLENMESAGIDPAGITHVFITHAHPDHIWGIRDDFDEAIFPDAAYFIGEVEHGYWMQDGLANSVAPEDQQFVVGAVNSINVDGADWQMVKGGDEIAPGISVVESFGHTPGHLSLHVSSGGKEMIATGDALSHAWMNFARPDWYNGIDAIPEATVASRRALLDRAATDRVTLVGYHFPFPGVGHVMREGEEYRYIPALWQFEG